MKIIGLCGYAGAGKDEAAKELVGLGWFQLAFADALREAAAAINPIVVARPWGTVARLNEIVSRIGWERAKREYPEVRRLLQRLGTEGGRYIHGHNCWVEIIEKKLHRTDASCPGVVFTDVRFDNEASFVRSLGGQVVFVRRDGVEPVNEHVSENWSFLPDVELLNNSTLSDLYEGIRQIADDAPNCDSDFFGQ